MYNREGMLKEKSATHGDPCDTNIWKKNFKKKAEIDRCPRDLKGPTD